MAETHRRGVRMNQQILKPFNPLKVVKNTPYLTGVILIFITVCLAVSFYTVPVGRATSSYNLTDLDEAVAEAFEIDEFSAGLLISAVILAFPTIMVGFALYKSRSNAVVYGVVIVDFVTMGFLVALGWLPYWIFLIVCLLIAVLMANQFRDLITGKG